MAHGGATRNRKFATPPCPKQCGWRRKAKRCSKSEADAYWDSGGVCARCGYCAGKMPTPPDTNGTASSTSPAMDACSTPATTRKRQHGDMDIETCSTPTNGSQIDSLQDEVRRLKATIALQTQKMRRHARKLQEIDEMTSTDGKIRALHEFREESKRWRTNNATGMDFKSAPLKQQFEGCTRAQQDTMLRDLIESLAGDDDSAQVQPQSLAHVLHRYLLARGSIHTLVHDHFKDDLVPCNMLDELASAILRYPERFTKKWRLEFVRMSDFIRHLNQAPGAVLSFHCCNCMVLTSAVLCVCCHGSTCILTCIWCGYRATPQSGIPFQSSQ